MFNLESLNPLYPLMQSKAPFYHARVLRTDFEGKFNDAFTVFYISLCWLTLFVFNAAEILGNKLYKISIANDSRHSPAVKRLALIASEAVALFSILGNIFKRTSAFILSVMCIPIIYLINKVTTSIYRRREIDALLLIKKESINSSDGKDTAEFTHLGIKKVITVTVRPSPSGRELFFSGNSFFQIIPLNKENAHSIDALAVADKTDKVINALNEAGYYNKPR